MSLDITTQRLANQQMTECAFDNPRDLVGWLGAVQAQDYGAAKWALGLRLRCSHDAVIDQAFTEGAFLRLHVMRPTWHFVLPDDVRWMQALTADRVRALMAYYNRQTDLDETMFARTNGLLARALEGGKQLTRPELASALEAAGIAVNDLLRVTHIMMRAELDCVICNGARRGKQFTYALLDERAPNATKFERDEALAELAWRYFRSHGPATLKDYAWWSGLTLADTKAGLDMIQTRLISEVFEGETYWLSESAPVAKVTAPVKASSPTVYLLPNFDEYVVAYTDRSAAIDAQHLEKLTTRRSSLLDYNVVIDGQIVGTWKRTLKKASVLIEPTLYVSLNDAEMDALKAAAQCYGEYLGVEAVLKV